MLKPDGEPYESAPGGLAPSIVSYKDGTNEPAWLIIAITVDDVQDVGRDAWVESKGRRRPIDRYELSGTIYQLRDDDLILGASETCRAAQCHSS